MDSLAMMSDRECVMLETKSKPYFGLVDAEITGPCITVLDLQKYEFLRIPYDFLRE